MRYNAPVNSKGAYNLAIETSCRSGSVTLGRGGEELRTVELPEQRRHAVELLPVIDRVCREHGLKPADLGEVYVSIGPGSFTGLRIGLTVAKVLSRVTGAILVPVPTLEVVAANAPEHEPRVAVMLNAKGGRCFTGVFEGGTPVGEPGLMTPAELGRQFEGLVIADHVPAIDWPGGIRLGPPEWAKPSSRQVWAIGRRLASRGVSTTAQDLVPLYIRLPEAEELWRLKHGRADGVVPVASSA